MRLSRSDLFPVLTIVAGGAVGFSLSFSLLLLSRSDDVPAPDPVVVPPVTAEALRLEKQKAVERLMLYLAREQGDIEAGMDRLAEARRRGTPLRVRPMRVMPQGGRGLTPEEWQERR